MLKTAWGVKLIPGAISGNTSEEVLVGGSWINTMAKFKRINKIGSGGFGEVWKSVRVEDGEECAMKVLLPSIVLSEDIERFKREVRLLLSLNHPRIIKVIGTHVASAPYAFWMPLYKGNLASALAKYVADSKLRNDLFSKILDGVAYAHSEGVIHRDLKPENILLDGCEDIVVSDFGLGRQLDSESTRKTFSGESFGTPYYMAPEQLIDAKKTDHRSDIYALGRILYELCTGDPAAAQQDVTKLDSGMRHLVAKATKANPDERFQDIEDFRRDFLLITSGTAGKRLEDDVRTVLKDLVETENPTKNQIQALQDALLPHHDDAELVHEVFMTLPIKAFVMWFEGFPEIVRDLLQHFTENVGEAGWGFTYCDTIAKSIMSLYSATSDLDMRTCLLLALGKLGVSHNRFYVINSLLKKPSFSELSV